MMRKSQFGYVLVLFALGGCAPKVGSEAWCGKMADTPKDEWKGSDAKAFARHCIFKNYTKD
jgi:hypothetical protein